MTNPDNLKNTYESLAAKYLTPEDHKTLEANGFTGMDQRDPTWDSLNLEAKNLILTNAAPDSPRRLIWRSVGWLRSIRPLATTLSLI